MGVLARIGRAVPRQMHSAFGIGRDPRPIGQHVIGAAGLAPAGCALQHIGGTEPLSVRRPADGAKLPILTELSGSGPDHPGHRGGEGDMHNAQGIDRQ